MVIKIHTKQRRYLPRMSGRSRSPRLKTFTLEVKAKEYAEKINLKNYEIVKARFGLSKKFKIVKK